MSQSTHRPKTAIWMYVVALALAIATFGVASFAGPERIHACKCGWYPSAAEAYEEAVSVFRGEIVEIAKIQTSLERPNMVYRAEFRVNTVWKGRIYETMFVNTSTDFCGDAEFSMDVGEYVIYAYEHLDSLWIDFCSRKTSAVNYMFSEDLVFLGKGVTPKPGSVAPAWKHALPTPPPLPTPAPLPTPKPAATLVAAPTISPEYQSPTGGGCNPIARTVATPIDVWPLTLVGGIAWIRFHRRRSR